MWLKCNCNNNSYNSLKNVQYQSLFSWLCRMSCHYCVCVLESSIWRTDAERITIHLWMIFHAFRLWKAPQKCHFVWSFLKKKRNSNVLHTGSKTYNTFTVERAERDKCTCGRHLIKNRLKNIGSQSQKTKKKLIWAGSGFCPSTCLQQETYRLKNSFI